MFSDDTLQPISALQHLLFCERQWGLIHLEGVWTENRLTAEGRVLHERVHEMDAESRGDVRIVRGLRIRSLRLGLIGQADVVELHAVDSDVAEGAAVAASFALPLSASVPGIQGLWRPVPVEYKRGRPKADAWDEVQVCAQALCLEEMLNVQVPEGALFYGRTRRRHAVVFDHSVRERTEALARRLHDLVAKGKTPPPQYAKKCDNCSLKEQCMPGALSKRRSARRYIERIFDDAEQLPGDDVAEDED